METIYLGSEHSPAGLPLVSKGKVRDIYGMEDERLLIVTTDRVSAFDVVMRSGVPHKGRVLTAVSAWWFGTTRDILPNHLVSTSIDDVPGLSADEREALLGRIMIVEKAKVLPVEWVVRGYLAGSGWKEYQRKGTVCGIPLPAGMQFCGRLPEPLLTPTTKSEGHDLPLTPEEARDLVGGAIFDQARLAVLDLFRRGTEVLRKIGVLLADTKFELGLMNGNLMAVDEMLTPDSSRFWPVAGYRPGHEQPSFDKQPLRDYLERLSWDKEPPPPEVDPAVLGAMSRRYLEICERLTGSVPLGVSV